MKHQFIPLLLTFASGISGASAQGYAYDDAGRLSKALYPDGNGVTYSYDNRDNISRITPIQVPPAATSLAITTAGVAVGQAEVSWLFSGSATGFLIQTKNADEDLWVDHTTVGAGLRAATVNNPQRLDLLVRVIVLGSTPDLSSAPSASIRYPLGVPRLVTIAADENDHALGLGTGDSLREVIEASFSGDVIGFAPVLSGRTIRLTAGQIRIDKNLTIDASSLREKITVDAGSASRALIFSGSDYAILEAIDFIHGSSAAGGAIHNDGAVLNLRRCTFSGNSSPDSGGAVHVAAGGLLINDSCVFDRNIAGGGGGAVYVSPGCLLDVNGAIFTRNEAAEGGAIHGNGAICEIRSASFSSNGAQTGGAIFNRNGTALVINSTLAFNGSSSDAGGGAACRGSCQLILRYCTVAANVGAGVSNADSGTVALDNSIISGNFNTLNLPSDYLGSYTAVGANVLRVSTGNTRLSGPAPLTSEPVLGTLNSSGVMPLLSGSPAIDAGVTDANTPSSDQERSSRPFGAGPDLGASEARLSAITDVLWLSTSAGQITPRFDSTVLAYTASVPDSVASAAVRAAKVQNNQTLQSRINGGAYTTLNSKEASPEYPLNSGDNIIELKVIAPNGTTTQSYTVTVTRGEPESSNIGVGSIVTTTGAISPAFDPTVNDYFLSVPQGTASTSITAPPAQPGSTVAVRVNYGDYMPLPAGSPSGPLDLHAGDNFIEVQVTDASGAVTAQYSLTVTREPEAAANAYLASLTSNAGTLTPDFHPARIYYALTVPNSRTSATVTPTRAAPGATIAVRANGGSYVPVASGNPSPLQPLGLGANTFEVKVTAQNGVNIRIYTVIVHRLDSGMKWASEPGNLNSSDAKISADGRFVAFSSRASNLVPNDTNNADDVFVYDRITNAIERVSVSNAGVQGDFLSTSPSISADGRFVAFQSEAKNLVPGDTNGNTDRAAGQDIFVYDRTNDTIERVSLRANGDQSNVASKTPSISADGSIVAFMGGNNMIAGFQSGQNNIYIRDRGDNSLVGISVPFPITPSNRSALNPALSADGNFVAFEFTASLNDGNNSFNYRDIYLFNRMTQGVERVTGSKIGIQATGTQSQNPSISADGRYIAFESNLEELDFHDINGKTDVFTYDRITGITSRVSRSGTGIEELNQSSINASISGDGRFVAFESRISNFVAGDTNGNIDVFVKDLITGEIVLKSRSPNGTQANGDSSSPSLSHDGKNVAFVSGATNLLASGSTNSGVSDVFVSYVESLPPGSLADLGQLTSNLGPITPDLRPGVLEYSAAVPSRIFTALVRPVAADPAASVEARAVPGEFTAVPEGGLAELPLEFGDNILEFKVTAADSLATRTYRIAVNRAAANDALANADLTGLASGVGALSPAFAADTLVYSVQVPSGTSGITLTPFASAPGATVRINGSAVASGNPSTSLPLNPGSTTITATVTAPDGSTTKTYAVSVTRAADPNADLASLALSSGSLSPAFSGATTTYSASVPNSTSIITVSASVAQPEANFTINGEPVDSGASSGPISLVVGSNTITVEVIAGTAKTYTVNLIREAPAGSGSIADWRQLWFNTTDNVGDAADNFDFDKDGLVNLIEFAFGLDPTKPDANMLPVARIINGNFTITFTQPANVSGITYGARTSQNLKDGWQPVPDTGTGLGHSFSVPVVPGGKGFIQLSVTRP